MAVLDDWFNKLPPKSEFTTTQASQETETPNVYYLRDWIATKLAANQLVKIGDARATKYRKSVRLMANVQRDYV